MSRPDSQARRRNRRGDATRQAILVAAVEVLSAGDPAAASVNQIARRAGSSWGAIAYQFGDVDGLWAAVLLHLEERGGPLRFASDDDATLEERVRQIITALRRGLLLPDARAFETLRAALPHDKSELEATYPQTAAALEAWAERWSLACEEAFADLEVDPERIRGIVALIPSAMRGLTSEANLSTYSDLDAALEVLTASLTAYLEKGMPTATVRRRRATRKKDAS